MPTRAPRLAARRGCQPARVQDNTVLDHVNDAISLTLPSGRTAAVAPEGPVNTFDNALGNQTYYQQIADVTALIRSYGAGEYIVGGVPGVLDRRSGDTSVGWTLAVVYTAPGVPLRDVSLHAGFDYAQLSSATGTTTPLAFALQCAAGTANPRLLVSAMEGDANPRGEMFKIKVDGGLAVNMSGPNNPELNFFGSQINGDDGRIDTSGWFGTLNHNPFGIPPRTVIGGRQGWDLTAIDLSPWVSSATNTFEVQGVTDGYDAFFLNAVAFQVDVAGPVLDITMTGDAAHPAPNQVVTYTATITNPNAFNLSSLVFVAGTSEHLAFEPNSILVNGAASPFTGPGNVSLPNLAGGGTHVVSFRGRVLDGGSSGHPVAAWSEIRYGYENCDAQFTEVKKLSNVVKSVYGPALQVSAGVVPVPIRTGDVVTIEFGLLNTGGEPVTAATFHTAVPAGTTYVPGSTMVDGVLVGDANGTMPFAADQAIPGAGALNPGERRRIAFNVRVNRGTAAIVASIVTDLDGAGAIPAETVNGTAPVDNREPPLHVFVGGPGVVTPGDTFEFTITVNNLTLDPVDGLTADVDLPAGVTFVPGACAALPCPIPALAPGASYNARVAFAVANPFSGGTLTATARVRDAGGAVLSIANATISILGRARYFAEGASNGFFSTQFSVINPTAQTEIVKFRFLKDNGDTQTLTRTLSPMGRQTIDPSAALGESLGAFSTVVESSDTLAVDRLMTWDTRGYGSSADNGVVSPSDRWFFAEGATGVFQLFYLLENPDPARAASVTITFLTPNGEPIVSSHTVEPNSRLTIPVHEIDGLRQAEVSAMIAVTNGVPIVADRAMYRSLPGQPFGAGHASSGSQELSNAWYFGEGATGTFFDTFLLLANPGDADATVTVRYQLPAGGSFTKDYPLAAHRRLTVVVEGEDPRLAATAVSMSVSATQPIVAERSMWWPGPGASAYWWSEAHAALGATQTAPRWAVASGANGGANAESTYVLVSNASETAGNVRLTLVLDNQTVQTKTLPLAGQARLTVDVAAEFRTTVDHAFSLLVEGIAGDGTLTLPLVVERSHYASPNGVFWVAGDVTLATPVP